ncbi:hypothetical protein OIU77_021150 [Salix suchowensis]|uniref:ZF-HD dimerization-type domain-containing protein n=3 Tax=Salix TaxID=40685 RepID=A0A9Q0ZLP4_9ROSI|nr:zinc finger family protein [Salix suchowensis]KAJ6396055.1 hypothetical protein OIU77_021150 [Salix suchowensis]KAJ6738897.1 hypothetical protein OIU74_003794 [Salix koriyanagi]KAJ6766286.1 hypothetical protein OIU79_022275 [Salix purpurea]
MPASNYRPVFQLESSSPVYQGFERREGSVELGTRKMRKRQVVVRRSEEPSRSSTTSSSFTISNVKYGECLKNHAAGVGGYAVDGCREFMASGEESTAGSLTCAACGCHRNFHRREVETEIVCDCSSPSSNGNYNFDQC